MKVLVIDAFDSFVFMIAHYYKATGAETRTIRVNENPIGVLKNWKPDLLVLGPGPGTPMEHGYPQILEAAHADQAIFGVCLGHQAIGQHYGWELKSAPKVQHGTQDQAHHDTKGIFHKILSPVCVVRYHSLIIEPRDSDSDLVATAVSENDQVVMGVRHRYRPIEGVQFHPESIGTKAGMHIIINSLELAKRRTLSSGHSPYIAASPFLSH